MKTIERKTAAYEAPQVEIIEIQVEQGFAASNTIGGTSVNTGMENAGGGNFGDW